MLYFLRSDDTAVKAREHTSRSLLDEGPSRHDSTYTMPDLDVVADVPSLSVQ